MVTSMIPNVNNVFKNPNIIDMRFLSPYNPLINYDWSTTTAKEYKTDGVERVINSSFTEGSTGWDIEAVGSTIFSDNKMTITRIYEHNVTQHTNVFTKSGEAVILVVDVDSISGGYGYFVYGGTVSEKITTAGIHYLEITSIRVTDLLEIKQGGVSGNIISYNSISIQKVIQEPNKRYLKDVGSTPTYNASMYFGRGAYLNGVDQTITVPINKTIQTSLKRVNGVVTISETSQTLTNYVISGLGVHKDYYLFTRLLTTAEKDSYTNTPEAFYLMSQADSTCVLNMPMCETDGYARNMKSYSEGEEEISFPISNWTIANDSGASSVTEDGAGNIVFNYVATDSVYLIMLQNLTNNNSLFLMEITIESIRGTIKVQDSDTNALFGVYNAVGTYRVVGYVNQGNILVARNTPTESCNAVISNISVKKLSGAYPVPNYTASVRDNAKNLQYGLQTCKFARDSLGVIQSASDYLECNGTGYAIIPSHIDKVNIKMTVNPTSLNGNLLSGGVTKTLTGLTLNIDNDVVINDVTPTGAITLANGFSGTIKTYTEELS